ncbi:hypothetical protein ANN_06843 [Periplaneta americana]|uniref:Uncharacterized protein n=1 Tax=Periplaneta americana TaxID=6978 RepID=A0ABQ8TES3_PERAM|nr:hypothetical protein ANN_06843 [Periplaneta americana]
MSPGSNTESYPAFAHIVLRENPGKSLNQVTCPDRESNPGHLVSRPDALTVTPQGGHRSHTLTDISLKNSFPMRTQTRVHFGHQALDDDATVQCFNEQHFGIFKKSLQDNGFVENSIEEAQERLLETFAREKHETSGSQRIDAEKDILD